MLQYGGIDYLWLSEPWRKERRNVKKDIHPKYVETSVTCSCGNKFTVMSNKQELHIEVCNKCHPFFVGGKEGTATSKAGRVEKFNRKYGLTTEK